MHFQIIAIRTPFNLLFVIDNISHHRNMHNIIIYFCTSDENEQHVVHPSGRYYIINKKELLILPWARNSMTHGTLKKT